MQISCFIFTKAKWKLLTSTPRIYKYLMQQQLQYWIIILFNFYINPFYTQPPVKILLIIVMTPAAMTTMQMLAIAQLKDFVYVDCSQFEIIIFLCHLAILGTVARDKEIMSHCEHLARSQSLEECKKRTGERTEKENGRGRKRKTGLRTHEVHQDNEKKWNNI